MQGKTIVITGATSGIGEVAAIRLAEKGARIVMIARDPARAEATLERLRRANPAVDPVAHMADLSRLSEMTRVAREIADEEPEIDVLINNAGALFNKRQVTKDGLEMTFALNHMSYFVVTNILLDNLTAAGAARIVSTSSEAHRRGTIDFNDLQLETGYGGFRAYCKSKLMNVLFTRELARRLKGAGVTANCLHPGFVNTRFGDNNRGFAITALGLAKRFAITPKEGAETIIYLASSPQADGVTGKYFYKCRESTPTEAAQNDEDAARLWAVSADIAGPGA